MNEIILLHLNPFGKFPVAFEKKIWIIEWTTTGDDRLSIQIQDWIFQLKLFSVDCFYVRFRK